ncbi:hypothetical protein CRE_10445 [Caenorhabditis remanei]|uniref:Sdz-33 F-box domain-containing protein n=1 Tax=Caenorhabditis remanei TaxID=31234 RepID=E3N0X9_CAERE|nr:hypothetical protein CRE_10445 [Caenorhabditis remanei]
MTPFPLLSLPRLAQIPVFQCMKDNEILAFCHVSKRTSSVAKCLKLMSPKYFVLKQHALSMEIILNFVRRPTVRFCYRKESKNSVTFHTGTTAWTNIGFSGEWIKRMFDVSNCDKFETVMLHKPPESDDFFSIFSDHARIENLILLSGFINSSVNQVVETLLPITSNIEFFFSKDSFKASEDLRKILIQEVDSMEIHIRGHPSYFNLSDLLTSNAVKLVLRGVTLTPKELNEFFKMWKENKCNPRLEYLTVLLYDVNFEDAILSGLDSVRVPEGSLLRYSNSGYSDNIGGFDIKRIDGKIGTIKFGLNFVNFYVWS